MADRVHVEEMGGGEGKGNVVSFVCLSPPHNSQSLPALWTKCKAGVSELELTQSEKMVGELKGSLLWGLQAGQL